MRNRVPLILLAFVVIAATPVWIGAQQRNALGQGGQQPLVPDGLPFDAKDLNGVWRGSHYGYNATFEPPLTPAGKVKFDAAKPSYGARIGTPQAANEKVPLGRRRAMPPAVGNDYVGACNPLGLVRLLVYNPSPMEVIQLPNRVFMRFEWTYDQREIWTDGRKLPNPEDYLPRWNGYSVGRWEGNTFVVNSNGFDDRQWLDHFGYPISTKMTLEERYTRTAHNIMELQMTVTDPEIYTVPWKSDLIRFRLISEDDLGAGIGWVALAEDKCIPFDEVDTFNRLVRDPAGGVRR